MEAEVMSLIEELGFEIQYTSDLYGIEEARVIADNEERVIRTALTGEGADLDVTILSRAYGYEIATFCFHLGEMPDLRFREFTPELLDIARRFGAIAGFDF